MVGTGEERASAEREPALAVRLAAESAQNELARSIRVRVEAVTETRTLEITGGTAARFEQSFSDRSATSTAVSLDLRRLETWYDPTSETAYAVCAVERPVVAESLRARSEAALQEAAALTQEAQALEGAGRSNEALPRWAQALVELGRIGEDLLLARGLHPDPRDQELWQRLRELRETAAAGQARLAGRSVTSVDDAVFVVVSQLSRAVAADARPAILVPAATVRDSRMSSPFGRFLAQALAHQLTREGWTVLRAELAGPVREAARASGAQAVLLTSTWDNPQGVRIATGLHRLDDGRLLAAAETALPAAGLAATGLSALPQNAGEALADQQQFRREEVLDQDLRLEVWTSKGDDAPVFLAGERVQIFVRVDRPCHLRLIYHLADGRRALLVDDLWLDDSKVNRVYCLPDEFEVDAPFGAEVLQAFASTEPLPRLVTRMQDGYPIISESLASANNKTRGLKKAKPKARFAEVRMTLTTMPR
ncbi:MAG: DUF4384 domain-containing protein [Planctomycetota bacterium]|nr:DUF4384 domain-containing protein [Planctomycetota bacterium]